MLVHCLWRKILYVNYTVFNISHSFCRNKTWGWSETGWWLISQHWDKAHRSARAQLYCAAGVHGQSRGLWNESLLNKQWILLIFCNTSQRTYLHLSLRLHEPAHYAKGAQEVPSVCSSNQGRNDCMVWPFSRGYAVRVTGRQGEIGSSILESKHIHLLID